ncbi:hypothetical protein E3P99_00202 [Wallemia hederae]|uniref:Uncharacterized protein n=1 Tax=Wallemia hederae TaxID=1540922 RepID=A0A4T0FWP4_9BASI|nr:hypothetical protein E3P99_00202 [Wallemia hederae]
MIKSLYNRQHSSTTPPNTPPIAQLKKSILKENGTPAKGNSVRFFSRDANSSTPPPFEKPKDTDRLNVASLDFMANSPNPFSRPTPANQPNPDKDDSLVVEKARDIPRSSPAKLKNGVDSAFDAERVRLLEQVVDALKNELEVEQQRHQSADEEVQRLSSVLDNHDVEKQLKSMQSSYQTLKDKIADKIKQHEDEISHYNQRIQNLESSNQSLEATNTTLNNTNSTLESENISYKDTIAELQSKGQEVENELHKAREEHHNALTARDEERAHSDSLAVKLSELQAKFEGLQGIIASRSNEQMLEQLKQLRDNSIRELADLQEELHKQRDKYEAQIQTLQTQLNESLDERILQEHKLGTLSHQLETMEAELNNADEALAESANSHEVEVNTLRNRIEELSRLQQQHQNEASSRETSEEVQELKEHAIALERELNETQKVLRNERSQSGDVHERLSELQAERDDLALINMELEKSQIRLQKEITSSGKYHDQSHIIEKLTKDLERYKQAHNNDQLVMTKFQDENARLTEDFENIKIALQAKQQEVHSIRRISGVHKLLTADDTTMNTSRRTSRRSSGFAGRLPSRPSLLRQESTPAPDDRPSEVLRRSVVTPSTSVPPRPPTLLGSRRRQSETTRTFLGSSTSTVKPSLNRPEILEPSPSPPPISPPTNTTHSSINMSYGQNQDLHSPSFVNGVRDERHEEMVHHDAHSQLERLATSELSFDSSTPSLPEPPGQLSFEM